MKKTGDQRSATDLGEKSGPVCWRLGTMMLMIAALAFLMNMVFRVIPLLSKVAYHGRLEDHSRRMLNDARNDLASIYDTWPDLLPGAPGRELKVDPLEQPTLPLPVREEMRDNGLRIIEHYESLVRYHSHWKIRNFRAAYFFWEEFPSATPLPYFELAPKSYMH